MVHAEAKGPRSPWNLQLYHFVYDTPLLSWLLLLESPYHNASLFQVIFQVSTQSDGFRCGMCTHACSHTLFLLLSPVLSPGLLVPPKTSFLLSCHVDSFSPLFSHVAATAPPSCPAATNASPPYFFL